VGGFSTHGIQVRGSVGNILVVWFSEIGINDEDILCSASQATTPAEALLGITI
jgi:hypothetical protein